MLGHIASDNKRVRSFDFTSAPTPQSSSVLTSMLNSLLYNLLTKPLQFSKQQIIPVAGVTIIQLPDTDKVQNAWQISSPKKSFTLYATTLREKQEWMHHLSRAAGTRVISGLGKALWCGWWGKGDCSLYECVCISMCMCMCMCVCVCVQVCVWCACEHIYAYIYIMKGKSDPYFPILHSN